MSAYTRVETPHGFDTEILLPPNGINPEVADYLASVRTGASVRNRGNLTSNVKRAGMIAETYASAKYDQLFQALPESEQAQHAKNHLHYSHALYPTYKFGAGQVGISAYATPDIVDFLSPDDSPELEPEVRDGVLLQLLYDAASYARIASAATIRRKGGFVAPVRNISIASPRDMLTDLQRHPEYSLKWTGSAYSGGWLDIHRHAGA
jgi:hypothetical protein